MWIPSKSQRGSRWVGRGLPHHGQLKLKTRGWGRGSSNESEILHVDSYPSNEVFLFFELYRNMPLNGWGAECPSIGQLELKQGGGAEAASMNLTFSMQTPISLKIFFVLRVVQKYGHKLVFGFHRKGVGLPHHCPVHSLKVGGKNHRNPIMPKM